MTCSDNGLSMAYGSAANTAPSSGTYTNYLTSRCGQSISRVGAADGELLAVGRMKDEAVAPADPQIELVDHSPRWCGSTIVLAAAGASQLAWRRPALPVRASWHW